MPGEHMSTPILTNSKPPISAPHSQDASPNPENSPQSAESKIVRNSHEKRKLFSRCVTRARTPVFIGEFHSSPRRRPATMPALPSHTLRNPQKQEVFAVQDRNRASFEKMRHP